MHRFDQKSFRFTREKFLSLPLERQHKKCAELLRFAYLALAKGDSIEPFLENYGKLLEYMALENKPLNDFEELSNQYHLHLRTAFQSLKEHHLLPRVSQKDEDKKLEKLPFEVYLDNLRSSFNVGNIIRTAECAGFQKVLFSKETPFIDNPKVVKSAMGSEQWMVCERKDIKSLKRPLIALETSEDGISLDEFIFPNEFTLSVGNEEYGSSKELLSEADIVINIPLRGIKNSLNVAQAFAIAAFSAVEDYNFRIQQKELIVL